MKPQITVALPLWNSKKIVWLCLESLCRQNVGVDWELIMIEEETDEAAGENYVSSFYQRLQKADCVNVKYIQIQDKIPLSSKWRKIADEASESSKVYVMCAADNYYQPLLLYDAWQAIVIRGYDWYQSHQCHFYDIDTKKLVEYRRQKYTGIEMAMSMDLAKKIPRSSRRRGIDLLIYNSVMPKNIYWNTDSHCLFTVCTHGMNKISGSRRKNLINKVTAPFRRCSHAIDSLLPFNVYRKLISL